MKTEYASTCQVANEDTGTTVDADILNFIPERMLEVSINKSIRVRLNWDDRQQMYIGRMAGMDFVSTGPASRTYRDSR